MSRSIRAVAEVALAFALAGAAGLGAPGHAAGQARPALEYEGAIATGLALRRLGNTARVLHIGAHPDDENTALFAPLALGRGGDAAYLSITRGEGGQNSLGPELGTALGLIRSEELLAARRIDGAAQFFTRAVDFGFSKNADETFTHWPRDSVLADIVAVIRRYRPDVVVSVWSGTRRDGHGHHEASGILAREAVLAADDPARFPEQIAAGLRPHTVGAYYWSARYGADGPDVELDTGELDPLLGRSYHQVAMASRSRHRSQDMGVPQAPGPRRTQFDRVDPANPPEVAAGPGPGPGRQLEGGPARESSLFADVDTLLSQRAMSAGLGRAAERLRTYETEIEAARAEFDPFATWRVVPRLLRAGVALEAARAAAGPAADELRFHLDAEAGDLREATIAASNLRLDAVSDDEMIIPGQQFELELSAWNGGIAALTVRMEPALPVGWATRRVEPAEEPGAIVVAPGERVVTRWSVDVPRDARLTEPYFLDIDAGDSAASTRSAMYDWPDDTDIWGLPFATPPVRGRFDVDVPSEGGTRHLHAVREATWIGLDAREGEFRRPVRVVPRVSVQLTTELVVIPIEGSRARDDRRLTVGVTVRNEAPDSTSGTVHVVVQEGWSVEPAAVEVTLAPEGGERTIRFDVAPPDDLPAGEHRVSALFETPIPGCGEETPCAAPPRWFTRGYEVIDYPHIDPHHLYRDAVARIRALDVRVADVRVGYVPGVPDGVPEALDQLGVEWEPLDEATLADGDLSRFEVIVTGTRAYEVRPDLAARNDRLLDWARAGGTLIVQYNKYPALEGSYAPWPVTIARPHGRVTDENAPVTVLEPDHPIFNTPNPIGPEAWKGWVQERGLYFWETWEGPLRPLLAMNDPGEDPLEGSLLVGLLGEGTYVYSALALFRQLPEGIPGAWRLLANLVSLGAEGAP
ncbi:MAG TPA: PIG-L family deacetylase [Gemmatimonadota bacterium]|nr:PIG-L family deacetylase [Gemmatimonadota bacterium]